MTCPSLYIILIRWSRNIWTCFFFPHLLVITRLVYQKYCEAMKELSQLIMELLALSLGVDRMHYRKFFEDGSSIMRCNYYPPCSNSTLTLGTGPHTDPTSITILHQDQVGGLQVFSRGSWRSVRPRPDAFVINIGDTFTVYVYIYIYTCCIHTYTRSPAPRASIRAPRMSFMFLYVES